MQELVNLINTVGFPVGVCLLCFYFIYQTNKQTREDSQRREDLLFTRIGEISKTLADVAKTLSLINERIEALEEKVNEQK